MKHFLKHLNEKVLNLPRILILQTRKTASWLAEHMSKDGHAVAMLSGELTVEQRIAVLNRFRDGKEKVLITTNVLSRGVYFNVFFFLNFFFFTFL